MDQRRFDDQRHVGAAEASRILGVKLETLYAYASRGLVRSVPAERGRARRYAVADLAILRARHDARSGHGPVAAAALRWGEPVLDSSISAIGAHGPMYRGTSAIELAERGATIEDAAHLLWNAGDTARGAWRCDSLGVSASRLSAIAPRDARPLDVIAILVPALAATDRDRFGATDESEHARGRALVRRMAASVALRRGPAAVDHALGAETIAALIGRALLGRARRAGPANREVVRAIDAALVLSADHELNASTFAARVAASTGADLYACVGAALATLSGPKHGGSSDRIEALVGEARRPERAREIVRERARRGEGIPGFGHPLYLRGDPRAAFLIDLVRALAGSARRASPALATLLALVDAMHESGAERAALDVALVAVAMALRLPPGSASVLFAIGRSVGWIAHVIEQRHAGYLVRPRARYVGAPA